MTPDQLAWLQSCMPEFLIAQSGGHLAKFYPVMIHSFLTRWPEQDVCFPDSPVSEEARLLDLGYEAILQAAIAARKSVSHRVSLHISFVTLHDSKYGPGFPGMQWAIFGRRAQLRPSDPLLIVPTKDDSHI
jgi:hypothetical protein